MMLSAPLSFPYAPLLAPAWISWEWPEIPPVSSTFTERLLLYLMLLQGQDVRPS